MGADLFSINGRLFRCVTVAVTQLILIMSFLIPYSAYANTASTLQTSYLGRLSNGYHQFKYTITNTATGLNKSVTKAISPASLGKVLRFVVSKRLAVFASFATVASDKEKRYYDFILRTHSVFKLKDDEFLNLIKINHTKWRSRNFKILLTVSFLPLLLLLPLILAILMMIRIYHYIIQVFLLIL